ncbi:MAG: MBL fold metallo-hydrolase [Terriglobales bacterium]
MTITRREALKAASLAAGGLTLGTALNGKLAAAVTGCSNQLCPVPTAHAAAFHKNDYFEQFPTYCPNSEQVGPDEMRITFLGTSCLPSIAQEENSIFVELGSGERFIFDCGSGVAAKYTAMKIPYSSMDKIFLTHLHGDHTSDLMNIYCFGPANDRKTPVYVWGPSPSGVLDPITKELYDDGTKNFCSCLRSYARWHSESFSFLPTQLKDYQPPWWDHSGASDGFDIVPFELDWRLNPGVAYPPGASYDDPNDVVITHFPAVHDRQGAISYKLEWRSRGLSMIFSGDTLPNYYVVNNAYMDFNGKRQGVDVLIHEMVVPPEVWAYINSGIYPPPKFAVDQADEVQRCSHTPQLAYGYILNLLEYKPRLAIGTHFQATNATVNAALNDILSWYNGNPDIQNGNILVASDLLVLNVTKDGIRRRRGLIDDFDYATPTPPGIIHQGDLADPKYKTICDQLDPNRAVIPWGSWNRTPPKMMKK